MEAKTILVVDDDVRLRKLLRDYLTSQGFFVVTAEDAKQAREKLALLQFDALVVDRMMPGEDGLSLTRDIQKQSAPILMLTAMAQANERVEGLEAGARDYLVKPFEPKELVLRLNNLLDQFAVSTHQSVMFGPYEYDIKTGQLTKAEEVVHLTEGERGCLHILAGAANEVVPRQAFASKETSDRSIDVQINRLRKKVEKDSSKPQFIQTIRGAGYLLRADDA